MAEYRLMTADPDGPVIHTPSNTNVPNNPANREWMVYRFWKARGGKPDPYEPPPKAQQYSEQEYINILEGRPPSENA